MSIIAAHTLLLLSALNLVQSPPAQGRDYGFLRLIRLDGAFGKEMAGGPSTQGEQARAVVTLGDVKVEAEPLGFHTRLRFALTIANATDRKMTEIEWRLDIYDEDLRILSRRYFFSDRLEIEPNASAKTSIKFAAVLPDRMILLVHLTNAKFKDGSSWRPPADCSLLEDMKRLKCQP